MLLISIIVLPFQKVNKVVCVCVTTKQSLRIRDVMIMRYTNLLFTYLLTYCCVIHSVEP